MTSQYIKRLNHTPVHFSRIILAKFAITPYCVTVCVFLSVNKTDILELNCFRHFIAYTFTMVNGLYTPSRLNATLYEPLTSGRKAIFESSSG
jgi:hypothetical protein